MYTEVLLIILFFFSQFDSHTGVLLNCVSFNSPPAVSSKKLALLSSEFDEPCTNGFDCPLVRLTNDLHAFNTSFFHNLVFTLGLNFVSLLYYLGLKRLVTGPRDLRRSLYLGAHKLVFLHNPYNTMFCHNIFCTSSIFEYMM